MATEGDGDTKGEEGKKEDCPCCYESFPEDELFECTAKLGHKVCQTCITNYVGEEVDGKNRTDFECFVGQDCKCQFGETVLSKVLPKELKERADRAIYRKGVSEIEDLWTCKVCNGAFIIDREYETQFCRGCNDTEYCTLCFHAAHPNKNCEVVKQETDHLKDPRQIVEEAMTEVVIRRCLKCQARFVKEDGCNRMTCPTPGCSTMSCYLCKEEVAGYEHFCSNMDRKSPSQPCPDPDCNKRCNLWTSVDVMEEIEKKWKLKAGRIALEKHGVTDPKAVVEMLASCSA